MNGLIDRPKTQEAKTTRVRTQARAPRARKAKKQGFPVLWTLGWFAAVWTVSSMSGQMMAEDARRNGLRDQERARRARIEVATLRDRVERLSSMEAVERWAMLRGMSPGERAVVVIEEPARVAMLH